HVARQGCADGDTRDQVRIEQLAADGGAVVRRLHGDAVLQFRWAGSEGRARFASRKAAPGLQGFGHELTARKRRTHSTGHIMSQLETWYPDPEHAAASNVTQMIKRLGVRDYDELYRFSIEHPAEYWRAIIEFCGVVWSRDYTNYADFSAGKEFPRWFVGGKL